MKAKMLEERSKQVEEICDKLQEEQFAVCSDLTKKIKMLQKQVQ